MAKAPSASTTKKPAAKKPAAKKAAPAPASGEARAKFAKALEEARAGAQVLSKQAQERAGEYRGKIADTGEAWFDEARARSGQALDKAADFAREGKTRTSEAISGLGQIIADTAPTIDEKLGAKYGDYARTAARSIQENAAKLESKDFGEIGNDARDFVKKSPGVAIGLAAVAGFMLARLFRGNSDD